MRRSRRGRKNPTGARRVLAFLVMALVLPLTINFLWSHAHILVGAGENAAMLAAAIQMPDSSLELLEERFRAEIYNPDDHSTPTEPDRPQQPDSPREGDPEVDEPEPGDGREAQDLTPRVPAPNIPEEYQAPIISENFAGSDTGSSIPIGAGYLRNETYWEEEEILEILETPHSLEFQGTGEPEVLIVHTHATEAFERYDSPYYDTRNSWRSTDNNNNVVVVGNALAQTLEEHGIGVLHDTTQHDHPSYNGSYERSAETIQGYLDQNPSIKVVLDVHRDAMQRGEAIVKPVSVIDGQKAAQVMIISACDDGTMDVPYWRENLRFATSLQNYMEESFPDLSRPIYFCYRKYNMDLTTGSLLLEFGSNANTLEEAVHSARMVGEALAQLIQENPAPVEPDIDIDVWVEDDDIGDADGEEWYAEEAEWEDGETGEEWE